VEDGDVEEENSAEDRQQIISRVSTSRQTTSRHSRQSHQSSVVPVSVEAGTIKIDAEGPSRGLSPNPPPLEHRDRGNASRTSSRASNRHIASQGSSHSMGEVRTKQPNQDDHSDVPTTAEIQPDSARNLSEYSDPEFTGEAESSRGEPSLSILSQASAMVDDIFVTIVQSAGGDDDVVALALSRNLVDMKAKKG